MRRAVLLFAFLVAACDVPAPPTSPPGGNVQRPAASSGPSLSPAVAQRTFSQVSARLRPVAVSECKRRTQGANCNFRIQVDPNPNAPVNAYQSVGKDGRPEITFTKAMIATARNADEMAFVMGHEAAHHIEGHLQQTNTNAAAGALILAGIVGLTGGGSSAIDAATQVGALVGSRTYSKEFELEADQLGTVITHKAGYNPLVGVNFFARIPDPGDRFLGSHPPNGARVQAVERTAANLGLR